MAMSVQLSTPNSELVSLRDSAIESYLLQRTALHRHSAEFEALNDEQREDVIQEVRKQMVIQQAVLASEIANEHSVSREEVSGALEEIESSFADAISFGSKLASWGLSREMMREVLGMELKAAKVLEAVQQQIEPVSDVECEIYYHMNSDKFHQPELRQLRHILVTINEDYAENSRGESLKRIKEVARQIAAQSASFEDLAHKYSECPTAMQGGELGWLAPGQLFSSLESAAHRLKPGDYSEIVESELGFHILRCDGIKPAKHPEFDEVKARLKEQLTLRSRQRAQKRWLQEQVANLQLIRG